MRRRRRWPALTRTWLPIRSATRAQDAAARAKAASDAAAAASDVAAAQAAQADAEAEQADAEKYAGMVQAAADQATRDAQLAAANTAVSAAVTAVSGLSADSTDEEVAAAETAISAAETAVTSGTMLTAAEAAGLNGQIAAAKTSLGTKKTQIADRKDRDAEEDRQRMAVNGAVSAAQTAVAGLSADSTDAEVDAAEAAIATAAAALQMATALPASEVLAFQQSIATARTGLATAKGDVADRKTHDQQLADANDAVDAAEMVVAALNEMSSDADVTAAEDAITAAKAAAKGDMLTADDMASLNGKIGTIETALGTANAKITAYRTHQSQHAAAMKAVNEATAAVAGLTEMSTDAEVTAAKGTIATAEATVTAGTMLTDAEKAALNGMIAIAKVNLSNTETQIAAYRQGEEDKKTKAAQLKAANDAIDAARTAVAGLTEDSDDTAVEAAQALIDAAKKAVTDGAMLTAEETTELNGKIATVDGSFTVVKNQIDLRKQRDIAAYVRDLFRDTSDATEDAEDAGDAAVQAGKDATKYAGMLDVLSVLGNSKTATDNAQMVLDADAAATQAAIDATAAETKATETKTKATALADGTERKTELLNALDRALKKAADEIKRATDIRDNKVSSDGMTLKEAVTAVRGTDAKKPETPTDRGDDVADVIDAALAATSENTDVTGGPKAGVDRVDPVNRTTVVPSTPAANQKSVFEANDSNGMTWAQIVGSTSLVDAQIGFRWHSQKCEGALDHRSQDIRLPLNPGWH